MSIPRSEYPRPQFRRDTWLCLNGEWQFEIDAGDSGLARGLVQRPLADRITVPFCPESVLSGIGNEDFMNVVWYRRVQEIPSEWTGHRILLHFQAVDYDATIWVNGQEVYRHRGGFTSFACDITKAVMPGEEAVIVVRARDFMKELKPEGKQSDRYERHGCHYTRTTGIWQTVWLEAVPQTYLQRPRITPDVANGCFHIEQRLVGRRRSLKVRAVLRDATGVVAEATCKAGLDFAAHLTVTVPEDRKRLWSPYDPHLYDLDLELLTESGDVVDRARSYAGLRSVTIDGMAVRINDEVIFQRLVLDQGYYPDGLMTAPSDEALVRDIELSMAAGFNGARLHQKVFEERFLYHADRMGYLVWGEFGDWGCRDVSCQRRGQKPGATYITQWIEAVDRDYSHPAIIGWCPLNETVDAIEDDITVLDDVTRGMFLATKAIDGTRPVLDASGYSHRVHESDVSDCHDYEQDPVVFRESQDRIAEGVPFMNGDPSVPISIPYGGQPFFVSEFGGIWWNPEAKEGEDSWGYGDRPKTLEEFYARFEGLCAALLDNPHMFGYTYTQLTDVFQEQNGIYTFDRKTKFDMKRIRDAQQRRAAIEQTA